MPSSAYDLQHQQFNKLELGATQQGGSTLAAVPDMFASGLGAGADSISSGSLSPSHSHAPPLPQHGLNTMVASTW